MASKFFLGPVGKDNLHPVYIRVQSRVPKVDLRFMTPIRMAEKVFNSQPGSLARNKYCEDAQIARAFEMMEEINNLV